MRAEALFLNGVYRHVLEDILQIQLVLPEQIMFLQPYKSHVMTKLQSDPPTTDEPMRLLMSVTNDLAMVHYTAEIVGWDDKRQLSDQRRHVLCRLIYTLQPTEEGLYDLARGGAKSVNLLHVRRMRRLAKPFGIGQLVNSETGKPVSERRTTSGSWLYVRTENLTGLLG